MKKIFTLMAAVAMSLSMNAQDITISSLDETLANDFAGGCEIDLNNDGLLELIVGGQPRWEAAGMRTIVDADGNEIEVDRQCWVFTWDGSKYKIEEFPQVIGIRAHVIPADFNGDGNIDLYIAGEGYDYTSVYLNDGNGNFEADPRYAVLDYDGNETDWYPRAADVADFNCDGLPDIVTIGWSAVGGNRQANCGVLINKGDGTFKNAIMPGLFGDGEEDYDFALCTVKAFDLNNDGWPDILMQGNVDYRDGSPHGRATIGLLNYKINDDGELGFFDMELTSGVSRDFGNGNFSVGDFNNDGTPDIFVTGEATVDYAYYGQLLIGKYSEIDGFNETSYTENRQFPASHRDIRVLNCSNMGVRNIDYNGDGYYDLLLFGWTPSMLDGSQGTQAGWLFFGSDNGLNTYKRVPGASEQGLFFLDYGVQGALNYAFTGWHADATYFDGTNFAQGRSMVFTKNPWEKATRPAAPTNVAAEIDDHNVTLTWDAPASEKKNVTYEYYLKNMNTGKMYNNVTSFVGGAKDGIRKVLREGNAYMNRTLTLSNLPDGTYQWGVQTVNAALQGSTFANGEQFVIGDGGTVGITINSNDNTNVIPVATYNTAGQQINSQRGINLVKMTDGSVRKVIK